MVPDSINLPGTYEVTKDTAFDLAALSLQADMGDYYDRASNQYFDPHTYVPPEVRAFFRMKNTHFNPNYLNSNYLNI